MSELEGSPITRAEGISPLMRRVYSEGANSYYPPQIVNSTNDASYTPHGFPLIHPSLMTENGSFPELGKVQLNSILVFPRVSALMIADIFSEQHEDGYWVVQPGFSPKMKRVVGYDNSTRIHPISEIETDQPSQVRYRGDFDSSGRYLFETQQQAHARIQDRLNFWSLYFQHKVKNLSKREKHTFLSKPDYASQEIAAIRHEAETRIDSRLGSVREVLWEMTNWIEFINGGNTYVPLSQATMLFGGDLSETINAQVTNAHRVIQYFQQNYPSVPIRDLVRFLSRRQAIAYPFLNDDEIERPELPTLFAKLVQTVSEDDRESKYEVEHNVLEILENDADQSRLQLEPNRSYIRHIQEINTLEDMTLRTHLNDSVMRQLYFSLGLALSTGEQDIRQEIQASIRQTNYQDPYYFSTLLLIRLSEYSFALRHSKPSDVNKLATRLIEEATFLKGCNVRIGENKSTLFDQFQTSAVDKSLSLMFDLAYQNIFPNVFRYFEHAQAIRDKSLPTKRTNIPVTIWNTFELINRIVSASNDTSANELFMSHLGSLVEATPEILRLSSKNDIPLSEAEGNITLDTIAMVQAGYRDLPEALQKTEATSIYDIKNFIISSQKSTSKLIYRFIEDPEVINQLNECGIFIDIQSSLEDRIIQLEEAIEQGNIEVFNLVKEFAETRHDSNRARIFLESSESLNQVLHSWSSLLAKEGNVRLTNGYLRARTFQGVNSPCITTENILDAIERHESVTDRLVATKKPRGSITSRAIHLHFEIDVANIDTPLRFELQLALRSDKKDNEFADAVYFDEELNPDELFTTLSESPFIGR